jgi:drug/metabolite transporter (DMT)-like permease
VNRKAVIRCLIAAILFGASAPAASRLAGSIPAFTLAGLLYVGAAMAVLPEVTLRPPTRRAMAAEWRPAMIAVLAGGAAGPVLLVAGLARTDAATASILLNAELAATVVLAALVFSEHLGRRLIASAALVTAAGALLTWTPGAAVDVGALLIIAACVCWGIDNGVTARIEHLGPEHVVALKGIVAGGANLAIGLAVGGIGDGTTVTDIVAALVIGAAGYGLSITLWVKGARDLGAARGQVIFATAPFIGAVIAWTVLGETITTAQGAAVALAAIGVAVSLRSDHEHVHHHHRVMHDHEHAHHDGHHDHDHDHQHEHQHEEGGTPERHAHVHDHAAVSHVHAHVPDLHHRHGHPSAER